MTNSKSLASSIANISYMDSAIITVFALDKPMIFSTAQIVGSTSGLVSLGTVIDCDPREL